MFQYVRVSLKHLWGAVLQSATEGVEELSGFQQGSRAKVDQPDVEFRVYDDIFILYVPVEHSFATQVTHCGYQLSTEIHQKKSDPITTSQQFSQPVSHLSEDVACQRLVQSRLHVDKLKQVKPIPVFLHDQLEETLILKHLQHLYTHKHQ